MTTKKEKSRPILIIRFPRTQPMEMFYGQMNSIKSDKGLCREYNIIFTKDSESDMVLFECLNANMSEKEYEQLQHEILIRLDPNYRSSVGEISF